MSLQSPTCLRLLAFLAVLGTLAILTANTAQAAADEPGTSVFPRVYLPLIAKNGQAGPQAPVITSTPPLSVTTGALYTYDVNAIGMPVPAFSLVVSPQGMTIDSISGVIQWTPSVSGSYSVTVRAGNGIAPDAEQPFVIQVEDPLANPIITSTPPLSATTGVPYTYDVNATGMPVPTFSLVVSPQGMTIDSITGLIQWTPAVSGTFSVTVRAGNGIVPDAEQPFAVQVEDPPPNPIIFSTPPLSATTGISYTYDVNATGTPTPTFSLVITPQGMTIDSITGLIQWTPAVSGAYSVTVRASNGILPDAEQPFEIQVGDPPVNPTITSTPSLAATAGISYTYDVEASGFPTPVFSLVVSPQGMTIDSITGLIQWTPIAAGSYSVSVRAGNGISPDAEQSFVVQVQEPLPEREWDSRLDQRGASLDEASVSSGQGYWRLIKAQWLDENEAKEFGPDRHILMDVLDENGKRQAGVLITVTNGGASSVTTEEKSELWAADFPMSNVVAPAYAARPDTGAPADRVDGMGLGSLEAPDFTHHASYYLVWQWTVAP